MVSHVNNGMLHFLRPSAHIFEFINNGADCLNSLIKEILITIIVIINHLAITKEVSFYSVFI